MNVRKEQYVALTKFRNGLRQFLVNSETLAKSEGLTPQQHQLMLVIMGQPERNWASIRTISEALLLEHNSTVQLIDRCIEKGLVKKTRSDSDRRVARIEITEYGVELLENLSSSHIHELKILSKLIDIKQLVRELGNN